VVGLPALSLAFAVFTAPASAAPAPPPTPALDTAVATGSSETFTLPGLHFPLSFSDLSINAQSDTSGQNASGTASFTLGELTFSGPVTCLSVTGPDRGAGTATAPTTAVLQFLPFGILTEVVLVDNGGNGADVISEGGPVVPAPTGCSATSGGSTITARLTKGRAVVFDAPPGPMSKEQCKDGGWKQFGFKNQGQCIAFVGHQPPAP